MDPVVAAALVGGLLGGGVTGAIIAGLVTLWSQNRAFKRDRETRFIDLRRERYATLLRGANEWVRLINNQRANAFAAMHSSGATDGKPELPETTELWHLAEEIRLLRTSVGKLAMEMVVSIVELGPFAVDTKKLGLLHRSQTEYTAGINQFNQARDAFREAATIDIEGT